MVRMECIVNFWSGISDFGSEIDREQSREFYTYIIILCMSVHIDLTFNLCAYIVYIYVFI